ncbi:hypothetical protein I6M64_08270 [Acinetobacter lactucae]|uniref:Uncharacterized protein n=1 Tax=Acinetobacter lactucae TaxID=1785128 RepID=A0ABS1AH81_9GAMM|nr:hypothetical protein [Acinetobacter lactucae]MBJ8437311.1 hypothetical protein [Acinetobacter lactucae]MCG9492008.1 hypothetical protein [Acinetobacter pittii]MCU4348467.1 hypothetical protein [Acinetobacter lactucae]
MANKSNKNQLNKNHKYNLYRHLFTKLDLSLTSMHFSIFHS